MGAAVCALSHGELCGVEETVLDGECRGTACGHKACAVFRRRALQLAIEAAAGDGGGTACNGGYQSTVIAVAGCYFGRAAAVGDGVGASGLAYDTGGPIGVADQDAACNVEVADGGTVDIAEGSRVFFVRLIIDGKYFPITVEMSLEWVVFLAHHCLDADVSPQLVVGAGHALNALADGSRKLVPVSDATDDVGRFRCPTAGIG